MSLLEINSQLLFFFPCRIILHKATLPLVLPALCHGAAGVPFWHHGSAPNEYYSTHYDALNATGSLSFSKHRDISPFLLPSN